MFFGIALTPMGWLIALIMALFAIMIPFFVIESVTSFLPDIVGQPLSLVLAFGAFPYLLCKMHEKKMFGQGRGSAFFRIYTIFFIVFGALFIVNALTNQSGMLAITNLLGGILVGGVGVYMFRWAKKTDAKFADALAAQAEQDRDQAINDQAEAILRAEQMKSGEL